MKTSVAKPITMPNEVPPSEYSIPDEDIARLAYAYWQARGCPIGSPEEDWYRAEAELRQPVSQAFASAA
jgi:hypothetical protein